MNIMIVGVGGQGTLLASRILGQVALDMNYEVKLSEVHGMSQRGGSVVTYVKFGKEVHSPVIDEGCADIILSFEVLEAYRYVKYLKKGGKIIVNTQKIDPMPVIIGACEYPEKIIEKIKNMGIELIEFDASSAAVKAGTIKAANVALLGVLAKNTEIDENVWINAVKSTVPQKFESVNLEAFKLGYKG